VGSQNHKRLTLKASELEHFKNIILDYPKKRNLVRIKYVSAEIRFEQIIFGQNTFRMKYFRIKYDSDKIFFIYFIFVPNTFRMKYFSSKIFFG